MGILKARKYCSLAWMYLGYNYALNQFLQPQHRVVPAFVEQQQVTSCDKFILTLCASYAVRGLLFVFSALFQATPHAVYHVKLYMLQTFGFSIKALLTRVELRCSQWTQAYLPFIFLFIPWLTPGILMLDVPCPQKLYQVSSYLIICL